MFPLWCSISLQSLEVSLLYILCYYIFSKDLYSLLSAKNIFLYIKGLKVLDIKCFSSLEKHRFFWKKYICHQKKNTNQTKKHFEYQNVPSSQYFYVTLNLFIDFWISNSSQYNSILLCARKHRQFILIILSISEIAAERNQSALHIVKIW